MLGHYLNLVTAPGAPAAAPAAGGGILHLGTGTDLLGVGPGLAIPLLTGTEYLIPAAVAFAGLHKLLQHQETGGGFLVDMIVKGGGAILIIQLVKNLCGL